MTGIQNAKRDAHGGGNSGTVCRTVPGGCPLRVACPDPAGTLPHLHSSYTAFYPGVCPVKIISGGQTGADRAALDAAIERGIPHGGWLPRGRKAEDGMVPDSYNLRELASSNYRDRTKKNILDSDATLIVSYGPLTGGSALTEALAIRYERPCLHLNMADITPEEAGVALENWLKKYGIITLNVAGPRASREPHIYDTVKNLILHLNRQDHDSPR